MHYNEQLSQDEVLGVIQNTMREKVWYTFQDDGSYDWPGSVAEITKSLREQLLWNRPNLTAEIQTIIEHAFTPETLTLVDGTPSQPFVQKIAQLGKRHHTPVIVWTVGDVKWQQTKYINTGTNQWIDQNQFRCAKNHKQEDLARAMLDMRKGVSQQRVSHIYVVDDKLSNLQHAQGLQQGAREHNIVIHDYLMKLQDPQANPTHCFQFLEREIQGHAEAGNHTGIISDFDGVIADTDDTLFTRASRDIASAYLQQHAPLSR